MGVPGFIRRRVTRAATWRLTACAALMLTPPVIASAAVADVATADEPTATPTDQPAAAASQPAHAEARLAWRWDAGGQVEWAVNTGDAATAAVLSARADGTLQLVDAATGKPRWPAPLHASPGVRLATMPDHSAAGRVTLAESAGDAGDVIYCFDRHALAAVRADDRGEWLWEFGRRPAAGEEVPGDPEVLNGWADACVTPAGVLAVNTDGTVVLLAADTGTERWRSNLGPLPMVRLHARGSRVAVLSKAGDEVRVAFIALPSPPPAPAVEPTVVQRKLDAPWPLWSGLTEDGLLTVAPTEAAVWPPRGDARRFGLDALDMRAASVALLGPAASKEPASPASQPKRGELLLIGTGPSVFAYDVATGERRWPRGDVDGSGLDVEAVCASRQSVAAVYGLGVDVLDVETGRSRGSCLQMVPLRFSAAVVGAMELHGVYRDLLLEDDRAYVVFRLRLRPPGTTQPAAREKPAEWSLADVGGEARCVLPGPGGLVLVTATGAEAWKLP